MLSSDVRQVVVVRMHRSMQCMSIWVTRVVNHRCRCRSGHRGMVMMMVMMRQGRGKGSGMTMMTKLSVVSGTECVCSR
jgi:NADH:ubiquinone oxidoreductase subunit F (NADH-binding)